MDAVAVTVAKAVTARIAAGTFSQPVTPERSYADWDLDLTKADSLELRDSEKLHVDVVSHTTEQAAALSARGKLQYDIPIDIAVRKRFGPDKQSDDSGRIEVEEIDKLMLLLQELHIMFTPQRLAQDFQEAVWQSTQIVAAPVRQHLRELRQFTGILRIVMRADAAI